MSNAAVVKLQRKRVAKSIVWLDDNFGESVHLHIEDFRADMSCEEFAKLHKDLREAINGLIEVEGFDCNAFDGVFLEQMLWKELLKLDKITIDEVNLSDLWTWGRKVRRIPKSRVYKGLCGDEKKAKVGKSSDHIAQTGDERIKQINDSIETDGYDTSKGYIVVYGNDNVIRDGQHRACALYHQHGDMKVKVMRLHIKGYKDINTSLRSTTIGVILYYISKIPEGLRYGCKTILKPAFIKKTMKWGYDTLRKWRGKMNRVVNKGVIEREIKVFEGK